MAGFIADSDYWQAEFGTADVKKGFIARKSKDRSYLSAVIFIRLSGSGTEAMYLGETASKLTRQVRLRYLESIHRFVKGAPEYFKYIVHGDNIYRSARLVNIYFNLNTFLC